MIATLCLAFAIAAPPASADVPWSTVARKLAPFMEGFQERPARSSSTRFARVLVRAGMGASYDKRTRIQRPGYFLLPQDHVIVVAGKVGGYLVFLHHTTAHPTFEPNHSAWIYFEQGPHGMEGWALLDYGNHGSDAGDSINPSAAVRAGRTLIVVGQYRWLSNSWQTAAVGFRWTGTRWREVGTKIAAFESYGSTPLKASTGAAGVQPILIDSRTYPVHMEACHAAAHLAYREKWAFRGGRPSLVWKRQRDTAYNTLDRLYAAIRRGDLRELRRHSVNASIAARMLALRSRSATGSPDVQFPGSYCFDEATALGIENLGITFYFVRRHGMWVVAKLVPAPRSKRS